MVAENKLSDSEYIKRLEVLLDSAVLENANLKLEAYNMQVKVKLLEATVRVLQEEITGGP